eukprot:TRINITY_DN8134_c0_g1_i1.p1 TRINITY_DN8134_c0_g1~~TRINITY_DN8134_c0_g1_i1.p1  ORF type:complete len:132 (-),score=0.86 TRINITY_DN8134_c0_g1_i1:219-614(-)
MSHAPPTYNTSNPVIIGVSQSNNSQLYPLSGFKPQSILNDCVTSIIPYTREKIFQQTTSMQQSSARLSMLDVMERNVRESSIYNSICQAKMNEFLIKQNDAKNKRLKQKLFEKNDKFSICHRYNLVLEQLG